MVQNNTGEIAGACYTVWQAEGGQSDINPAAWQDMHTVH